MKISELQLNPTNPRKISDEALDKLCDSIQRDPQFMELRPIVYDEDGYIRGGNQRYKALQKLGYEDIPDAWCKQADNLTPEQLKRFTVIDNQEAGEWDYKALQAQFDPATLEDLGFDDIKPPKLDDVSSQIQNETEYQEQHDQADETAQRISEKVNELKQHNPEALNNAVFIALDTRKGNELLVLTDPTFTDFISEIRRYADNGEQSPLEQILDKVHKL